jgi:hypothetical protein
MKTIIYKDLSFGVRECSVTSGPFPPASGGKS